MNVQTMDMTGNYRRGASVRDVIIAKAIQNGYNPYCKSTDASAKCVSEEMRAKAGCIAVPENKAVSVATKKSVVRDVTSAPKKSENRGHREVVHIENFQLVKRRTPSVSLGMLVSFMVTAMVLSMVVFSGSLINVEARRYSELTDTLAVLKEEEKALALALEEKHELVNIDDFAISELGMIAANTVSTEYISLSEGDSVAVYAQKKENTPVAVNLLNTFGDTINNFLEYLD